MALTITDIEKLLNRSEHGLDGFIESVSLNEAIDGCASIAHCHVLKRSPLDEPKVKELSEHIAWSILDYAIPRKQILEAKKKSEEYNNNMYISKLESEAKELFTNLKTTGEGGEMLLYLLIQELLKAPQLLCKMPLKTDNRMHVHGIDGIHMKVEKTRAGELKLVLFWGESKLHKTLSSGIKEGLDTLSKFLTKEASPEERKKDITLIRDNIDLGNDSELQDAILDFINPASPNSTDTSVEYRGAILLGFDEGKYGELDHDSICSHVQSKMKSWIASVKKEIDNKKLSHIEIHVFLLPFPSVEGFRKEFLSALGID